MSYQETYIITFIDTILHWITIFLIGLALWYGAKIEGKKARHQDYKMRRSLCRILNKKKLKDIEQID